MNQYSTHHDVAINGTLDVLKMLHMVGVSTTQLTAEGVLSI
jgi:hypothetical protein